MQVKLHLLLVAETSVLLVIDTSMGGPGASLTETTTHA